MEQKRTASYAEALRGNKSVRIPQVARKKVSTKDENPNEVGPLKAILAGKAEFPRLEQAAKVRNAAKQQPSKTGFSYAEAVKGEAFSATLRPKRRAASSQNGNKKSPRSTEPVSSESVPSASSPATEAGVPSAKSLYGVGDEQSHGAKDDPTRPRLLKSALELLEFKSPNNCATRGEDNGKQRARGQNTTPVSDRFPPETTDLRPRRFSAGAIAMLPSVRFFSSPLPSAFSAPPSATSSRRFPAEFLLEDPIHQATVGTTRFGMHNLVVDRSPVAIAAHDRGEIS